MIADTETPGANECAGRRERQAKPLTSVKHLLVASLALLLAVTITGTSCGASTSGSWSKRAPTPGLAIEGFYEWLDANELQTGCMVQIFVQDERYRGWVLQDPGQQRECQLRGFELTNFEARGVEIRVSVRCPRAGYCPGDMSGSANFIMTAVPGAAITGRVNRGSDVWRAGRWREATLVFLREREATRRNGEYRMLNFE